MGFNKFSVGTNKESYLGFDLYFDKGKDKIMQKYAKLTKEQINAAILQGIGSAFEEAKREVGSTFGGKITSVDVPRGSYVEGAQLADINLFESSSGKGNNAAQVIFDSLGFKFLDKRGRYIRVKAGSFNERESEPTGVRAKSHDDLNTKTTEGRKPQGGFNLAVAYEGGVRPFKYNFKNPNVRGVTPTRTAEFDATPGSVLLRRDAEHPGFPEYGMVGIWQREFQKTVDTQVINAIEQSIKINKSIELNGPKFSRWGGYL